MNLGNRIAKLRKNKNWIQSDLANKFFVTDKTISSWESNRTKPSLEIIIKLNEIFACNISYLIYGNNTEKSDIETEIKIKLTEKEFKTIELFMQTNAKFLNENKQFDTYYHPIYRMVTKKILMSVLE